MLGNLVKRSRFFIANRAKIDRKWETSDQHEIGFRFYEGIAGGAILIGEPPQNEQFKQLFDWPDAIVPLPFHDQGIVALIRELASQPARVARIRSDNLANALLRHDWLHRWFDVLHVARLEPTRAGMARMERLVEVSRMVAPS